MNDLYVKIIYCTIIFVFSFLTSLALQLNKFAKDKDMKTTKYGLVYISDAIVSSICGFLFGLMTIALSPDNQILWVVAGILGGFLGQKLILIILKIFLSFFKNALSGDELQKIIKNLDNSKISETNEKDKSDTDDTKDI